MKRRAAVWILMLLLLILPGCAHLIGMLGVEEDHCCPPGAHGRTR